MAPSGLYARLCHAFSSLFYILVVPLRQLHGPLGHVSSVRDFFLSNSLVDLVQVARCERGLTQRRNGGVQFFG